uniref:Uncharacterized protein n=1 Tax=Pipistrellus kuhlii TaxID=59472 RepID=A0A7J7V112_PIPKU|nr:hypothetical protein mPipKuh1_008650 [Pipistrellus kuhlii]
MLHGFLYAEWDIFLKKNIYFIDFVQRGRERDRELETSMRESHQSAASCTPPTGDMPATKAHAPDRNRTRDPSVPKPTLYPLSQTGLGRVGYLDVASSPLIANMCSGLFRDHQLMSILRQVGVYTQKLMHR